MAMMVLLSCGEGGVEADAVLVSHNCISQLGHVQFVQLPGHQLPNVQHQAIPWPPDLSSLAPALGPEIVQRAQN